MAIMLLGLTVVVNTTDYLYTEPLLQDNPYLLSEYIVNETDVKNRKDFKRLGQAHIVAHLA